MVSHSREYIINVCIQTRKHDLCLRIAETAVELDDLHSCRSLHQTAVKDSGKRTALSHHACSRRLHDLLKSILDILVRDDRNRRISSHSAGIRALVSFIGTLVVL